MLHTMCEYTVISCKQIGLTVNNLQFGHLPQVGTSDTVRALGALYTGPISNGAALKLRHQHAMLYLDHIGHVYNDVQ